MVAYIYVSLLLFNITLKNKLVFMQQIAELGATPADGGIKQK